MAKYVTTLASPRTQSHLGYGGFFDEVYVKDTEEDRVLAIFFGPESWKSARQFIENKENEPKECYYWEIIFTNQFNELIHWFFKSKYDLDNFLNMNPSWVSKVQILHRKWTNYAVTNKTKQYSLSEGALDVRREIYHPIDASYAIFKDRRKSDKSEWYLGIRLTPTRRESDD